MTSTDVPTSPGSPARWIDWVRDAARLSGRTEYVVLVIVWLIVSGWVWGRLDQGWVAHDDGSHAQSAMRVLDGQLPHRDFAELYTGGMTFMNAATIYLFGEDLVVLRYPLFALFVAFVPAAYFIARSVAGPWTALLTAIVAGTWSIAVYPAAMVSWYELMFSVLGAACLVRWRSTLKERWLLAAGVLAGISVAFKIVGVYFVVAVLLFLLFVHGVRPTARRWHYVDWASLGALALAGGLLVSVLGSRLGSPEVVNLALPVAAVAVAVLVERMRRPSAASDATSASALYRSLCVFLGGVAIPLGALLVPYVALGAIGDFVEGVFVSPQSRRELVYWPTPPPARIAVALLLVAVLVARKHVPRASRRVVDLGLAAVAVALLVAAGTDRIAYSAIWVTARGLGPVIVLIGVVLILNRSRPIEPGRRDIVFLLVALVALLSLVQFPYGIPLYYCYVAPLVALAAVAVVSYGQQRDQWVVCALLAAFALYGAAYLDRAYFGTLSDRFVRDGHVEMLDTTRASIRIVPGEAAATRRIVALLRRHSRGSYIFAGPDMPQVYFLTDRDNPTRSLFDLLDPTDSARGSTLLRTLREKGVSAIAVNSAPIHSEPLDSTTSRRLATMYPNHARVGAVDVRWRVP